LSRRARARRAVRAVWFVASVAYFANGAWAMHSGKSLPTSGLVLYLVGLMLFNTAIWLMRDRVAVA
jgi:hypothetical protein